MIHFMHILFLELSPCSLRFFCLIRQKILLSLRVRPCSVSTHQLIPHVPCKKAAFGSDASSYAPQAGWLHIRAQRVDVSWVKLYALLFPGPVTSDKVFAPTTDWGCDNPFITGVSET